MKLNTKLIRVALAASVGSVLWAGCAKPGFKVVRDETLSATPVDRIRLRPDTHPELRPSIWQVTYQNYHMPQWQAPVADTTIVHGEDFEVPVSTKDHTELMVYDPETVNIALGDTPLPTVAYQRPDGVIVEAAGAERGPDRRPWRTRVLQNKERLEEIAR